MNAPASYLEGLRRTALSVFVASLLLFALGGCQRDLDLENRLYPCSTTADCPPGQACDLSEGVCVPEDEIENDAGGDTNEPDTRDTDQMDAGDGEDTDQDTDTCEPTNEVCDGVDNDCDGEVDEDFPERGEICTVGNGDCEATGNTICVEGALECNAQASDPETTEEVACDGDDEDCDGEVDEDCDVDGDGWCDDSLPIAGTLKCNAGANTGDCDDSNPDVYPDAPGRCDGLDNDCNGKVDEITGSSTELEYTSAREVFDFLEDRQAVATDTPDGFCAFVFDEQDMAGEFVVFDVSAGSASSAPASILEEVTLQDLAYDGTSCTLLYWGNTDHLVALRYDTSSGVLEKLEITGSDYIRANDAANFNAALTTAGTNPSSWYVAFGEFSGINHDIYSVELPASFTSSTTVNKDLVTTRNSNTDRVLNTNFGASPVAGDDFLLTYRHNSAELGMHAYDGGTATSHLLTRNVWDYEFGHTVALGGSTYLTAKNTDDVAFVELDSSYAASSATSTYTIPENANAPIELTRNAFAYGDQSPSFMLDSWSDTLVRIDRAADGSLTFESSALAVWSDSELIGIGQGADKLRVLRLSSRRPYDFHVDTLTCH